jgi:hypothetical protein
VETRQYPNAFIGYLVKYPKMPGKPYFPIRWVIPCQLAPCA